MAEIDDGDLVSGFLKLTLEPGTNHAVIYKEEVMTELDDFKDDYYIHIDIENAPDVETRNRCGRIINSYMLRQFYFDPRRYHGFFDTVFDPDRPTLQQMREVSGGMSPSYRELWRVKRNFNACAFFNHLAPTFSGTGIIIKMCLIIDNEHSLLSRTF
jgi:hypothetical protein